MTRLAAPLLAGADVLKILAGRVLVEHLFNGPRWRFEELSDYVAALKSLEADAASSPKAAGSPNRSPGLRSTAQAREATARLRASRELAAHEAQATEFAKQGCFMDALRALQAALLVSEKFSFESVEVLRERLVCILASSIAWALDLLIEAGESSRPVAAEQQQDDAWQQELHAMEDEALDMLAFAIALCSHDPANLFSTIEAQLRLQLRALINAALGCLYRARQKLQASLRYLEEAASGHCGWAHIAVLMELGTVRLHLADAEGALAAINEAVICARCGLGIPVAVSAPELENMLNAAQQAVALVFPRRALSTTNEDKEQNTQEVDARQQPVTGAKPAPPSSSDKLQASHPRWRSPPTGPLASLARPAGGVEVEVAVLLLSTQKLLWPWPEFQEAMPASRREDTSNLDGPTPKKPPSEQALLGLRRHLSCLQQSWPHWSKRLSLEDIPAGQAVLQECVLLAFANAAISFSQLTSPALYERRVLPTLSEGLAVAIVTLGAHHSLTTRLTKLLQKAAKAQETSLAVAEAKEAGRRKEAAERDRKLAASPYSKPSSAQPSGGQGGHARPCSAVAPSARPDEPEPPQQTGRGPQRGERPRSARATPKAGQDDAGERPRSARAQPRAKSDERGCSKGSAEPKRAHKRPTSARPSAKAASRASQASEAMPGTEAAAVDTSDQGGEVRLAAGKAAKGKQAHKRPSSARPGTSGHAEEGTSGTGKTAGKIVPHDARGKIRPASAREAKSGSGPERAASAAALVPRPPPGATAARAGRTRSSSARQIVKGETDYATHPAKLRRDYIALEPPGSREASRVAALRFAVEKRMARMLQPVLQSSLTHQGEQPEAAPEKSKT